MWITIIKENFSLVLDTFIKRPFVAISLILLTSLVTVTQLYFNAKEDLGTVQVSSSIKIDSLQTEIKYLKQDIEKNKVVFRDVESLRDSILLNMIRNNLIK